MNHGEDEALITKLIRAQAAPSSGAAAALLLLHFCKLETV